jgi:hypothetical protein
VVAAAVVFGLVALWPERTDVWYLNDAAVHRSMVRWAADRLREGHLPFDGWYPYLSLGASRFHHYQSLPHILTGALSLATGEGTFRWTLYLLLAAWPVAVYAGARLLGLAPWPAAAAAAISPLLSSAAGLGYEWGSYVWRGAGAWAQLWGMWALPFAWGLSWQAIGRGRSSWLAGLAVGITICLHLLTGYLALLSIVVFVFVSRRGVLERLGRAALVFAASLAVSAWMLVPLLTDAGWTVNDEFSRGTVYYDSFGAGRILSWFVRGDLFDEGRAPVVTALLAVGLVVCALEVRRRRTPRIVLGLGVLSMVLFFGRPTLGPALDLLPGGADLFLRRFISGVHLAGIYVAGVAAVAVAHAVIRGAGRLTTSRWAARVAVALVALVVLVPAGLERMSYERQGARWIDEQVRAEATDGVGFEALVDRAQSLGPGRIFSSLRGPRVAPYRIGQVPTYAALLDLQADGVGFTRPTWSLMSPAEYRFLPNDADQRDLFGVRYVIWPEDRPLPSAERVAQAGRHVLWELPVRLAEVVDTVAPIAADRTDIGSQMSSVLTSGLFRERYVPTVAFGGRPAAAPVLGAGRLPPPPGSVGDVTATPEDGSYAATVHMDRAGVVLFKVSFDPRFVATVDGAEVETQMLAPALVGVPAPPGDHEVTLRYRPYPYTLPLIAVGVGCLAAIALVERRRRRADAIAVGRSSGRFVVRNRRGGVGSDVITVDNLLGAGSRADRRRSLRSKRGVRGA